MKFKALLLCLIWSISAMAQTTVPTDTWFSFPLNGNATDVGENHYSGTISGGVTATTDRYGNTAGAMEFNGLTGFIDIPCNTSVGTGDFSISYWARPDAANTGYVISKEEYTVPANQFRVGNSGDYFGCFSDNTSTYGGGLAFTPAVNVWSFYTVTRQGGTIKLYVNGVYKSSLVTAGTINHVNTRNYRIGSVYNSTVFYKGKIDDLRMFRHALSTDEIAALYTYNDNPSSDRPVIHSFSPVTGKTGSTVVITGTGFSAIPSENRVFFGDIRATVIASTTTSVTVTVPLGAGSVVPLSVTVKGKTAWSVNCATPTFTLTNSPRLNLVYEQSHILTGTNPSDVATGDFNGDGYPDLVTTNQGANTVSILAGDGTGGFGTPVSYATGNSPQSVTVGDFNGDGKPDLATANYTSNNISVLLGQGDGTFSASVSYPVIQNPRAIKTGDFNGDGFADLVTANFVNYSVSVLMGLGDGTFSAKSDFYLGYKSTSVDVGDFNGDGKADLVTTNGNNTVSTWLGSGDGTFNPSFSLAVGNIPQKVTIGDFNRDGKSDLAVANEISMTVSVLLGSGNGTFTTSGSLPAGKAHSITTGDFNGDGNIDLATSNVYAYSFSMDIFLNNGDGSFATLVSVPLESISTSIISGDFNRDGKADLAAANFDANTVSILLNAAISLTLTVTDISLFTAMLDGDIPDLGILKEASSYGFCWGLTGTPTTSDHVIDFGPRSVTGDFAIELNQLMYNNNYHARTFAVNSAGTSYSELVKFSTPPHPPLKIDAFSPVTGPPGTTVTISGNGFSSVPTENIVYFGTVRASVRAATSASLTVTVPAGAGSVVPVSVTVKRGTAYSVVSSTPWFTYTNSPVRSLVYKRTNLAIPGILSLATGDFNNDGKSDWVAATSSGIRIFTGDGTGSFVASGDYGLESAPAFITTGDFNGDGNTDLAMTYNGSDKVSIMKGDGAGNFGAAMQYPIGLDSFSAVVGDFNGDGKSDLAAANGSTGNISVLMGDGTGSFENAVNFQTGTNPFSICTGDFNRDGKTDLATANWGSHNISILTGDGNGGFEVSSVYQAGTSPISVTAGDFNRDGIVDLAVANSSSKNVSILMGDGTGGFTGPVNFSLGTNPDKLTIGDFNGDGNADLAVFNNVEHSLSILLGKGDGTFSVTTGSPAESDLNSVATADFNGDGIADWIASNSGSDKAMVFLNASIGITTQSVTGSGSTMATANGTITDPGFLGITSTGVCWNTTGTPTIADNKVDTGTSPALGTFTCSMIRLTPNTLYHVRAYATNSEGTYYGEEVTFTTLPFKITSFTPVSGPVGTTVTLTGTGFSSVPSDNIVYFGAVKAIVSASSTTSLTLTVPPGAGSVVPVSVVLNGAMAFSTTCPTPTFNVTSATPPGLVYRKTDTTSGGTVPAFTVAGDFNGDGKTDLVVANSGSDNLGVFLGDGSGSFSSAVNYAAGDAPRSVVVSDFNGDGKADLACANMSANNVSVLLGNGTGGFAPAVQFPTASGPLFIVADDFNGDQRADLVTANIFSHNISVLMGNGTGGFATALHFNAGTNPVSISTGDFNKDGQVDLAVAENNSGNVNILTGNGNGTFASPVSYAAGVNPISVTAGDFNKDGNSDLAVVNAGSNTVSVFPGTGSGNFGSAVNYAVGTNPVSVCVGDFNGDGRADLAVANNISNDVSLLLGNGTGSFAPAVNLTAGKNPSSISAGDFDGDGMADLATTNSNDNTITILQYAFLSIATQTVTGISSSSAVGSGNIVNLGVTNPTAHGVCWNTSGSPTLANSKTDKGTAVKNGAFNALMTGLTPNTTYFVRAFATNTAGTIYGNEVTFKTVQALRIISFAPVSGPTGTLVTLTGTGFSATSANNIVYIGAVKATVKASTSTSLSITVPAGAGSVVPVSVTVNGQVAYSTACSVPVFTVTYSPVLNFVYSRTDGGTGSAPRSVVVCDFNGDGKPDMATANQGSNVTVLLGNGNGSFTPAGDFPAGNIPYAVAAGDFTGDGIADLAIVNYGSNNVSVLKGVGDGTFVASASCAVGDQPRSVAVDDFNRDGKADLVVSSQGWSCVSVLLGLGNGTFMAAAHYTTVARPFSVTAGDFNGDGYPDLATANEGSSSVSILKGLGDGTFTPAVVYAGEGAWNITTGDFNQDGKTDLVTANYSSNVGVLLGNGDGTFSAVVNYAAGSYTLGLATGDFNGDGKADLATTNEDNDLMSVLPGNGNGTFASPLFFTTGSMPQAIAAGDFNRDGKADISVVNYENSVNVFLNSTPEVNICIKLKPGQGWNLFSVNNLPETTDLKRVFQPWIDKGRLVKIQDEIGNSLENLDIFGGWINSIGDLAPAEGYKIKVSSPDSLVICGKRVQYPYPVPLKQGWNIMGYPQTQAFDGMDHIVKQLIDRNTLVKVQDEKGNSIENLGIFGGWQNNIGNFIPGKGYKIKLSTADTLWIEEVYPK